jgi:predicted Zn-dependent peptidase
MTIDGRCDKTVKEKESMFQKISLANGLRIVCETIPHVHSVSMGVWVGTGSRYEDFFYNGISHFVEHMLFKGTKTRSAKQIAEEIDAVGGQLNAFTTKEYTCYYVKLLSQHFRFGIDLLSDMILNSVFDPVEIAKEKSVVLEEINSYEDAPDELIHDLFVSTLLKNHPLGWNILGSAASIAHISRKALLDFMNHHYTPDNMVFAVAGNIQLDQIVPEIAKNFVHLQGSFVDKLGPLPPLEASHCLRSKDTEQAHLCIGTRGVSRQDRRKYAVFVLDSILGGSVSSRLFQRLREERGLVYVTGSSHSSYRDTGIFSIYAGTSMKNVEIVKALVYEEIGKLCQELVDQPELIRAKEQIKGNLLLGLESTCNRMSRLAKMELFRDRLTTPEETVARIDEVTSEAVLQIASEMFKSDNFVTAAVGPFG